MTRLGSGGWAETAAEAYERTGRLLAGALGRLGVPAVLAPGSPRGPGAPRAASGAAPPCFASTARHELVADGRKLAGIAQRSMRGALLQQGSLLLGDSHVKLAAYLRVPEGERPRLAERWLETASAAGRWLGEDHSIVRLGDAFAAELGASLVRLGALEMERLGLPELPRRSG